MCLSPPPSCSQPKRARQPNTEIPPALRSNLTPLYESTHFKDLSTSRQLAALTTFSDLVQEVHKRVTRDAIAAGLLDDGKSLNAGGSGATAYADALAVYL